MGCFLKSRKDYDNRDRREKEIEEIENQLQTNIVALQSRPKMEAYKRNL